jgi:hypothetical protein
VGDHTDTSCPVWSRARAGGFCWVACKLAEGLALAALIALLFQETMTKAGHVAAWRVIALLIVALLLVASLTYGLARVVEPALPRLHEESFGRFSSTEKAHFNFEARATGPCPFLTRGAQTQSSPPT